MSELNTGNQRRVSTFNKKLQSDPELRAKFTEGVTRLREAAEEAETEESKVSADPPLLDVINALRAVIVALHHWQDGDGNLSTSNAKILLNLLADAEAKLQLP